MDKIFNISVNKYTQRFLSKELEIKYENKIKELGQTQEIIGTIIVFIYTGGGLILECFQLYFCMKGVGRFQLTVEITLLITIFLIILLEGLLLWLNKFRWIKGTFFIIGFIIVCC